MKIKDFYTDASRWTQNSLARDINNNHVNLDSNNIHSLCLLGALHYCYLYPNYEGFIIARDQLYKKLNSTDIVGYNNNPNRTFEDIKQLVTELDI